MKYTLHVPVEQYGFIQVDDIPTREEAILEYKKVAADFINEGLDPKEFNAILDDLLDDRSISGDPGSIEKMSPAQRFVINEIKKSFKRTN